MGNICVGPERCHRSNMWSITDLHFFVKHRNFSLDIFAREV